MPTANLFAQGLTHALYETEVINRKLSLGGALHTLASRHKLQQALDTYGQAPLGLGQSALRGALLARHLFSPITIGLDVLVGTGRTHFAPGERRKAAQDENSATFAFNSLKSDLRSIYKSEHEERLAWLTSRFTQNLEHPCDAGFLGIVAGASSLPMLFIVSAAGSMIGAIVGSIAYLAQRASGNNALAYRECVNDVSNWFCGVPAMLVRAVLPNMSIALSVATRIGALSIDISNWAASYLALQGCRVTTATLKLGVSALGATLGVAVGLGVMATRAVQARLQPQRDAAAAPGEAIACETGDLALALG